MFYMRYLTSVLFLFLGILPLVSFGQEVHTIKAIGDLPLSDQFQVRVNGQAATVEKLEKFDVPIHYSRIASCILLNTKYDRQMVKGYRTGKNIAITCRSYLVLRRMHDAEFMESTNRKEDTHTARYHK